MIDTRNTTTVEHSKCVSCGSVHLKWLQRYAAAHLVRCQGCGLVFCARRPTDSELEQHYGQYGDWPDSALTRARYREVLLRCESYRSTGRVFELGCGAGYFLEEAAAAGWDPYGSTVGESSLEMCRAKGLQAFSAQTASASLPAGQFDVAAAFEVVEHLRDPAQEASLLARVIRPGGVFYCTTPNFDSVTRRLLGPGWRVIAYPEHLIYFTAATLERWLAPFGFHLAQLAVTGVSPGEVRRALRARPEGAGTACTGNRPASGAAAVREVDERVRAATENGVLFPTAKRIVNRGLTSTRFGETLKAWFVRVPD